MSEAFSRFAYYEVLDDIEKYLGYLKGNELCSEYLRTVALEFPQEGIIWPIIYESPCPVSKWERLIHIWPAMELDASRVEREIKEGADQSWNNGVAWASGLADYLRELTDQITKPYVPTLAGAVADLQRDVVTPLKRVRDDDWAYLGGLESRWRGLAADEFRVLYANYDNRLALYGQFSGFATLGLAAAAAVIASTQDGLTPFVEDVRDHLKNMLERWSGGYPPHDPEPLPAWVGDVAATVGDVVSIFADVHKAVKTVDKIITGIGKALDIVERHSPAGNEKSYPAADAEEIYTTLTETLHVEYLQAFQNAFEQLSTGAPSSSIDPGGDVERETFSGDGLVEELSSLQGRDWFLPEIAGNTDLDNGSYGDL